MLQPVRLFAGAVRGRRFVAEDYSVGYGKPPRQHQFKQGNQLARKRRVKTKAIAFPEIIDRALRKKRKIKRGDTITSVPIAEILVERLIQMMTTGSARDLALIVQLLERYLPDALAAAPETLEISYHRADGSSVPLPPSELWDPPA